VNLADTPGGDPWELLPRIKPLLEEVAQQQTSEARALLIQVKQSRHFMLELNVLCTGLLQSMGAEREKGEVSGIPFERFRDHLGWVEGVAFSPDGGLLASASDDKTIVVRRLDSGDHSVLTGHTAIVYTLAFSPDGNLLASGSQDKTVRIWDVRPEGEFKVLRVLDAHRERVSCVAFHPDSNVLASADFDQVVKIWDVATWKEKSEFRACEKTWQAGAPGMLSIAFSPEGGKLAIGGVDLPSGGPSGVLRVVDLKTGAILWTSGPRQFAPIFGLRFSPDGKIIAVADKDQVRLLDAESYTVKVSLRGHRDFVNAIDFSPDGRVLASGSGDKQVILWDWASKPPTKRSSFGHGGYVMSVKYSPDGRTLAVGDSVNTVTLWDVHSVTRHESSESVPCPSPLIEGKDSEKTVAPPTQAESIRPRRWWEFWGWENTSR
jgi:WD40 repeat protein